MDVYPSASVIALDRYQDFKAVTLGAGAAEAQLSQDLSGRIQSAYDNYVYTSPTIFHRGIIYDYIKREYSPVYVGGTDLTAVAQACKETLAVRGLRGAYYRVRGFKKAAHNIVDTVNRL